MYVKIWSVLYFASGHNSCYHQVAYYTFSTTDRSIFIRFSLLLWIVFSFAESVRTQLKYLKIYDNIFYYFDEKVNG